MNKKLVSLCFVTIVTILFSACNGGNSHTTSYGEKTEKPTETDIVKVDTKFKPEDLKGKTFSMHNEDGSIFMPSFAFTEDKINGNTPYTIENGILKLRGMSFKKTGESEDGSKIYFEDMKTGKKYYFQVKEEDPNAKVEIEDGIEKEGILYSDYKNEAIVFLDRNKNLKLDKDEPRTKTDKDGNFKIEVSQSDIDKRKSLVAIKGKNAKNKEAKEILFATIMANDKKTIINTYSSALTAVAFAISANPSAFNGISHPNMMPSLAKSIGIEEDDFNKDITKDKKLYKKALRINAFVRALANTYNSDKPISEKILEAYKHLFSNIVSNNLDMVNKEGKKVDVFGFDKFIKRFNDKNQMEKDGDTFEKLLKRIDEKLDSGASEDEIEKLIKEAVKFREKSRPKAKAIEYNHSEDTKLPKDQFSKYQWHLKDQGAVVNTNGIFTTGKGDLGVDELYKKGIVGQNAHVRVVDDGVEYEHEDLKARVSLEDSFNAQTKEKDPTAPDIKDSHGTQVAGLIAADGSNKIGLRGVAPYAKLSAYKLRTPQPGALDYTFEELTDAWLGGDDDNISIVNNSWGSAMDKYIAEEKLLRKGATSKRVVDGRALGRIYLIAAGNGGFNQRDSEEEEGMIDGLDDSNTSYLRGSQYAITVAALRNENIISQYSTQGSNVLVSGYSGGTFPTTAALTATTTRTGASKTTWPEDKNKAYTFAFNGTSAATPVTSGALALVLSECPNLTYRDVKWLIAHTAKKVDVDYNGKTISGVKNVPSFSTAPKKDLSQGFGYIKNGAGLTHSNYYGYGLINPVAMIEKCKSSDFKYLPSDKSIKVVNKNTSLVSLDNDEHWLKEKIRVNIPKDDKGNKLDKKIDKVEWVGLTLYGEIDNLQKLSMVLISPSGTKSRILTSSKSASNSIAKLEEGYRFSSVAFVDEDPYGEWTLLVQSEDKAESGRFEKMELEVVGWNSKEQK